MNKGNVILIFTRVSFVLLMSSHTGLSCLKQHKERHEYPKFGRDMRSEFLLKDDFIQLNHGSYGTYPKATQAVLRAFQDRVEANPDLWMRREVVGELAKVRKSLADLMNADVEDIVMIPNTTGGMNAIFRSLMFKLRERILHMSTIYESMGSLVKYICDTDVHNVTSLVFNVKYPISSDQLVANFATFLEENQDPERSIRIALIDHITSVPGAIVPIERIIPILRQYNILVVIDGAHAIGQIPIDIKKLAPDYYISNCHKWLYSARGSSVMYVNKALQPLIHPAHITSRYQQPADFQKEFHWTGTMDFSSYMSVGAAIQFRNDIGGEEAIRNYTHQLAVQGGAYLAERFKTQVLQRPDQIANMVDVRHPITNLNHPVLSDIVWWVDSLLYRFNLYSAVHFHNGHWYIRNSAQIYNDMVDFEYAADVFLTLCNEINTENGTVSNGASYSSASMQIAAASSVLAYEL